MEPWLYILVTYIVCDTIGEDSIQAAGGNRCCGIGNPWSHNSFSTHPYRYSLLFEDRVVTRQLYCIYLHVCCYVETLELCCGSLQCAGVCNSRSCFTPIEAHIGDMEHIPISGTMVWDHFPDRYVEELSLLNQKWKVKQGTQ